MTPGRYVEQPAPVEALAVRYSKDAGDLLDLLGLAMHADADAEIAKIPAWNAAVIRFGVRNDPDYLVVPDGWWLLYRNRFLGVLPDDEFTRRYQPAPPMPDVDNVPF